MNWIALLEHALLGTTLATCVTTLAMMPAWVRRSRLQAVLLLTLIILVGALMATLDHAPFAWPLPAVSLVPLLALFLGRRSAWDEWARINGACLAQQALLSLLLTTLLAWQAPPTLFDRLLAALVWLGQLASLFVSLPLAFDIFNTLGRRRFPARDRLLSTPEPRRWPSVCVQIPAYDEPPELLAATIRHLLQQDYPGRWMIQVIDNNTPSPLAWLPVWDLCRHLGERVQFVHLHKWPGYKAGALNEGTRRLPAWVEVIAVVDADYLVEPHFLRATARHFADPTVAFVQSPQHYRQWQGYRYWESLNFLYETFFVTYMPSRRELNSIICAGTMGLVRRSALEAVGLWDEASITEDAEVAVRLLLRGWTGIYDHRRYGAGLMPFDFASLKKQRFRWAFGTIQLLKKHWRALLGFLPRQAGRLTWLQRGCYLGLGMQYLIEVVSLFFALLLLFSSLLPLLLGGPPRSAVVQQVLWMQLLLLVTVSVRTIWALRALTRCTLVQACGALFFFFSLSWVTAHACLSALFHRKGVFLRTPKVAELGQTWWRSVRTTLHECALCLLFLGSALVLSFLHPGDLVPALLLGVQGFIYGCSPLLAVAAECFGARWKAGGQKRPTSHTKGQATVSSHLLPVKHGS